MALNFETTHEYYLRDANIYYCVEHESLIVTQDHQDRLLITGIDKDVMLKFATKLYRDDLNQTLESIKESTPTEKVDV